MNNIVAVISKLIKNIKKICPAFIFEVTGLFPAEIISLGMRGYASMESE